MVFIYNEDILYYVCLGTILVSITYTDNTLNATADINTLHVLVTVTGIGDGTGSGSGNDRSSGGFIQYYKEAP